MITTATATRPTAENLFQRNFWAEPSGAESHAGKAGVFARQGADPIEPHPAKVRGSGASNRFLRSRGAVGNSDEVSPDEVERIVM
jgi:hypothetical protein